MFYLSKKRMMSALEPHMKCLEPLKTYDLKYNSIPYLVIKDEDHYYFSDLKYRETTYTVYGRQEPTLSFDFEFAYNGEVINEQNVLYMEVAYQKWLQVYKDAVFEKDDIKDMYLVFYKNRRHNGSEIFDVSVYYNMKKVIELNGFSEFCDDYSNIDFHDFSYIKITDQGYEETWRVVDFVEEFVDKYAPWEDDEKMPEEDYSTDEEIESMDYDELIEQYLQHEKKIRDKIVSIIGNSGEFIRLDNRKVLLDEADIKKACCLYYSKNAATIEPPASVGTMDYNPSPIESLNDNCIVFENGVITDYFHLSTSLEAEWDRNDRYKGSHYAADCRYISIDGTIYDLLNPQDIMSIPVGEPKIDVNKIDDFMNMIGYDSYDSRLNRILETESKKLYSLFWVDEIDNAVNVIKDKGVEGAVEYYLKMVEDVCNTHNMLLSKTNQKDTVEYYIKNINSYFIEKEEITFYTPDWCIEYLQKNGTDVDVEDIDDDTAEFLNLAGFWDYDRSMDFVKMMTGEGLEAAEEHFLKLASEYCEENNISTSPEKFIGFIKDTIGVSEEDDDGTDEEFDDYEEGFDDEDSESSRDLFDLLYSRTTGCFEPALLVPLAYTTINIALKDGDGADGCERIIAQLVANNEDEYGILLDEELSKRSKYWDKSKSVAYGMTLKNWAVNTKEYMWLLENFPDQTPKTKGAYTRAKSSLSKKYLELKALAAENGYILDDSKH